MPSRNLLFEIGTEELPPKSLSALSLALEQGLALGLNKQDLAFDATQRFATPRRLAVLVRGLIEQQPDKETRRFGPAVKAAFDEHGTPTKAALGFARSCGVEVSQLDTLDKDGVEKLAFSAVLEGKATQQLLPDIVLSALQHLPIPKRMRWGSSRVEFVRPVHWALLLFGEEHLTMTLLGVETAHSTYGHRFHYNRAIPVHAACDYEQCLEEVGGVIPEFDKRKQMIRQLVTEEGRKSGAETVIDEALLDEVTSLVEYPVALAGKFDPHFLEVPAEALILAMKTHQKCFYLVDKDGALLPGFVTVSNLLSKDPDQVIRGNERVIRPRLADARFFFEADKQRSLESQQARLKDIIFQEKLGTLYEKSQRVASLSEDIATRLEANTAHCRRAALLGKCDLLTNMVGEFADLQGLMGYYYAVNDGEPEEVAIALNEQYMPRFSGDGVPATITGSVLAIADKLDTIVGIFGIDQSPTGSRDPFALRRAALGILRIIVEGELQLDLRELIATALNGFNDQELVADTGDHVFEFMLERFRAWYAEEGISSEQFQSVFAIRPGKPLDFHRRIMAVNRFSDLPEAAALAAANKRVSNLLLQQEVTDFGAVSQELLQEPAEEALNAQLQAKVLEVAPLMEAGYYEEGLTSLATLKESVDRFFDEVLVMCDDSALRTNRLAMLQQLRSLFLQAADISLLHKS